MNNSSKAEYAKTLFEQGANCAQAVAGAFAAEIGMSEAEVFKLAGGFGGGVGSPFFTTDTGAVLRAALIGADMILLAKNVDGVYSADPKKDPNAVKYDSLTYSEVLAQRLAVMDSTATCMAMDNHIPVMVFALKDPQNIQRALCGETIGTIVR